MLTFHVQRQQSLSVQRQHFVNINVDRLNGAEHHDIVTIVEAPDESSAMSLNFSLGALGNVRTESLRAFSAAEMTTIVGKMI